MNTTGGPVAFVNAAFVPPHAAGEPTGSTLHLVNGVTLHTDAALAAASSAAARAAAPAWVPAADRP